MRLVIVSGLSGSGKSRVVDCLEDMGFYCIDNIPPVIIPKIAQVCIQSKIENLALVTDMRGGQMFADIHDAMDQLKEYNIPYEILFLEASDTVLVKRFKETRRKHPLISEGSPMLLAIAMEREHLKEIRDLADHIIDTSNLTPGQLKEQLTEIYVQGKRFEGIVTHVVSFGFKYGVPLDADLVFDVRFLPNPFYIKELKPHSGLNQKVRDYVFSFPQSQEFLDKLTDMIEFLYPYYIEEGKSQLVIAIGCTGGMHRSVAIAKALFDRLTQSGHKLFLAHRDREKNLSKR